ncbi:PREDICTED: uncharacterized protein LOC109482594 [Branchiostoma belcheri]|uniref:Uncharacterized protein LOC109482594 n=1 Tax=Branchiostoma belcheri TaxID=7741 RepID=A0A6P4ZIA5_BRABE|nr:PREDICTED: uncharacterized protein LOC109482594 [Branchiostoma belcheri]
MPPCVVCSGPKGKDVTLFTFPKDDNRLHQWLVAVRTHLKPPWTVEKIRELRESGSKAAGARICSDHFSPTCCKENLKTRFQPYVKGAKFVLTKDAVPTLFGEETSRKSSESQRDKRSRKKLIESLLESTSQQKVTTSSAGSPHSILSAAAQGTSQSGTAAQGMSQLGAAAQLLVMSQFVAAASNMNTTRHEVSDMDTTLELSDMDTTHEVPQRVKFVDAGTQTDDESVPSTPTPQNVCSTPTPQNVCSVPTPQNVCSTPNTENVCSTPTPQNVCSTPTPQNVCSTPTPQNVCSTSNAENVCSTSNSKNVCSTPKFRNVCSTPKFENVCSTPIQACSTPNQTNDAHDKSFMSGSSVPTWVDEKDISFHLSDLDSDSEDGNHSGEDNGSHKGEEDGNRNIKAKYFITHKDSILQLFQDKVCAECNKRVTITDKFTVGSMLTVKYECPDFHSGVWRSQPRVKMMGEGNLLIPGAILFSGGTYQKFSDFCETLHLQNFSETHFNKVQRTFLLPAIDHYYNSSQEQIIDYFRNTDDLMPQDRERITLLGDGRCDSPGHNAKYCTYSFMEESSKYILHFEMIQVTETGSSQSMETEGFRRGLNFLLDEGIDVDCVVTDRHRGVGKVLKERKYMIDRTISHQYDLFHVSKSITKKISAEAKKKKNRDLQGWTKSISNHLWWCASTCGGDDVELMEKWESLPNHIGNIHLFPDNVKFKKCEHPHLTDREWLKPGTEPHKALRSVVTAPTLLRDIPKLTGFHHTGDLEVFHNMLLKYTPKRLHFWYMSMMGRMKLAVLDHNYNVDREQATTKEGEKRWDTSWRKRTKAWTARRVYEGKTYEYKDDLMAEVVRRQLEGEHRCGDSVLEHPDLGASNIATVPLEMSKAELVRAHQSRFDR